MFDFNIMDIPEPLNLYLCKPNRDILYQLNGIDDINASIKINFNNQYELYFDYLRYIDSDTGKSIESNGYHNLVIGMYILVEKIGYFKIKYPTIKFDGNKEVKSVTAFSIDHELEDKDLVEFNINTGKENSAEYLVKYEDGETESLINDYTGLPYDYIVFYNTFSEQLKTILDKYKDGTYRDTASISEIRSFCDLIPRLRRKVNTDNKGKMSIVEYVEYTYDTSGKNIVSIYLSGFNDRVSQLIEFYKKYREQLSLMHLIIEKFDGNWTIGNVDDSLVNKKFQFESNGENVYSLLTNTVSSVVKCVFSFDLFQKKINVMLAENIGDDSGIVLDKTGLLNLLDISCNSDTIYTRYNVTGGNDIDIKYVNFGRSQIIDLSYFMNARDEDNKRIYVSDTLADKYNQYLQDIEVARDPYISLTKQYNKKSIDINEIQNRLPNDSLNNEWDTFSDADLEKQLLSYHQLLATLQSLYKEDFGTSGCNPDGSINEDYIRNTFYWYDYYAYKVTIEQIEQTIKARAAGSSYKDISDENVLKLINAFKTEWSLYGTAELANKLVAYDNSLKVLVDSEAVILKNDSNEAKTWDELLEGEKKEYSFYEQNYQYKTYMRIYNERKSCEQYLNKLNDEISVLENERDSIQNARTRLVRLTNIEYYDRIELSKIVQLPSPTTQCVFSKDEIQILNTLYSDKNYKNDNILTTSLDDTVTEIDIQYELLEDAKEQLSIESQPQISFTADIEDILAIPEFKGFDFKVGNFVTLQYYDDYYIDVRLVSMDFNPCIPEDHLTVSFSNFINSKSERSDISSILGLAVGNSSKGSSGGSSSGSGKFGEDKKVDVTISNIMLSKLLNTEMFGTRVSNIILDTIKVNEIQAKYAKFEGLAKGTTIIDGKCLKTGYIIDKSYNGRDGNILNTTGSVINLETGLFNLGGGSIKYDGSGLYVKGTITADAGYIGGESGFVIGPGKLYSNGKSTLDSKKDGVYVGTNGISIGDKFKIDSSGYLTATHVTLSGNGAGLDISDNASIKSLNNDLTEKSIKLKADIDGVSLNLSSLTETVAGNYESLTTTIEITAGNIRKEISDTYTTKADTALQVKNLNSNITQTAGQILNTVSSTTKTFDTEKLKKEKGITITKFGYGTPAKFGKDAYECRYEYYLDQSTGDYYYSDSNTWTYKGKLEFISESLFSKIDQTADQILSTVSKNTKIYDTTGITIDEYGYGTPDSAGKKASDYNGKYYMDRSTGDYYLSGSGKWTKKGTFKAMSESLSSQIKQTSDQILSTVSKNTKTYDTDKLKEEKGITITEYGYGKPTDAGKSASAYGGKYYLDQSTGKYYYSNSSTWTEKGTCQTITQTLSTEIDQNADQIKLRVKTETMESYIDIKSEYIHFKTNKLSWSSSNSSLDTTGILTCTGGKIACWNIDQNAIYYGNSSWGNANGLYFGKNGLSLSNKFTVNSSGHVNIGDKLKFDGTNLTFASDVKISWGQVTGTTNVANKSDIPTDVSQLKDDKGQKWSTTIGENWIKTANVTAQNLKVKSANIEGSITASSFNYTSSTYDCSFNSGIYIERKSGPNNNACFWITASDGTMLLHNSGLLFYTGKNQNGHLGSLMFDSKGFRFSDDVAFDFTINLKSSTSTITHNHQGSIFYCDTDGKFFYGVSSNYVDYSDTTVLRGKYVRLHGHSGGAVYLGNTGSTAVTSDERFKILSDIDERYEQFFYNLKPTLYKYRIGHRQHIGFGARAVEDALKKAGLNTEEFAGILIDKDITLSEDEMLDPGGNTHFDELYYLRYEEFISLNTLMLQKALSRITELENIIKKERICLKYENNKL